MNLNYWDFIVVLCVTFVINLNIGNLAASQEGPVVKLESIIGGVARLPCDIDPPRVTGYTPHSNSDRLVLVIWSKEGSGKVIYSVDARGLALEFAHHWSDENTFQGRAEFHFSEEGASALVISALEVKDSGMYRCRVDFQRSPTRNSHVNLTVLEPPRRLTILDNNGAAVEGSTAGLYAEGSSVNITCLSSGGKPTPRVTWWQEHALLDDTFVTLADGSVRNTLHVKDLTRSNNNQIYTCQASNSHIVSPISDTVKLQLKLDPLWVRLQGMNVPLVSGRVATIACEVVGASPTPRVTWLMGGVNLKNATQTTSTDGNTTISRVTFTPASVDHGKMLLCRVETETRPVQDIWRLQVMHSPIVFLTLGAPLQSQVVKEGTDVYLECHVKANPHHYHVIWKHKGEKLLSNHSAGVIITNNSLVLQNITRFKAGGFTCHAENSQGTGNSHELILDVLYAPFCTSESQVLTISSKQDVNISCNVESNPENNITYTWKQFTFGELVTLKQTKFNQYLFEHNSLQPLQKKNSLLCYAANTIGSQEIPCETILQLADRPQPVQNCSLENQGVNTLLIQCTPGYDGGAVQQFQFQVSETISERQCFNITTPVAILRADNLPANTEFKIQIISFNSEGESEHVNIYGSTLRVVAKKNTASESNGVLIQLTPLLGALVGTVGTLVIVAICIVIMIRCKTKRSEDSGFQGHENVRTDKNGSTQLTMSIGSQNSSSGDKSVDVIPHFSDEDYLQESNVLLYPPDGQVNYKLKPVIHDHCSIDRSSSLNVNKSPYPHGYEMRNAYPVSPNVYSQAPTRFRNNVTCLADNQSQRSVMMPLLTNQTDSTLYNTS